MVPVRLVGSAWILPLSSAALSVSRLVSRWQNNKFGMGWDGACGQVDIWVCLKMGYTPNYSHLVGIMIINHWV